MTADERDRLLALDDTALLRGCREERRAAGGPGGQKRNRTASTVRLTHTPTGRVANAGEFRSLTVNRGHALRRLRHKIAATARRELDAIAFERPTWLDPYVFGNGSLRMNPSNPLHPRAAAIVLDVLAASAADPAAAALHLGVSPRSLVRFLREPGELWRAANELRAMWSLDPIRV